MTSHVLYQFRRHYSLGIYLHLTSYLCNISAGLAMLIAQGANRLKIKSNDGITSESHVTSSIVQKDSERHCDSSVDLNSTTHDGSDTEKVTLELHEIVI